jgi:hypothetical protein
MLSCPVGGIMVPGGEPCNAGGLLKTLPPAGGGEG